MRCANSRAVGFAAADVNLDFHPDLIVANQFSKDITVFPGTASGSFGTPLGYQLGFSPKSIRIGDVDADSNTDVAVLSIDGKTVGVLRGQRDGVFRSVIVTTFPRPLCCIELADMNRDGADDRRSRPRPESRRHRSRLRRCPYLHRITLRRVDALDGARPTECDGDRRRSDR
jgi:hypothetical protein